MWLDLALRILIWSHGCPCFEQEVGLEACRGPLQPGLSNDPVLFMHELHEESFWAIQSWL